MCTLSHPLYIDFLARALTTRATRSFRERSSVSPAMPEYQRKALTDFIDANLEQKLHIADLAEVVGMGATRFKEAFRNTMGMSVRQYVIRRRVAYARGLIETTTLPISEIALAAGFTHQSHMVSTMRRLLGRTPGELVRPNP